MKLRPRHIIGLAFVYALVVGATVSYDKNRNCTTSTSCTQKSEVSTKTKEKGFKCNNSPCICSAIVSGVFWPLYWPFHIGYRAVDDNMKEH